VRKLPDHFHVTDSAEETEAKNNELTVIESQRRTDDLRKQAEKKNLGLG
jgi:hypothetical protein